MPRLTLRKRATLTPSPATLERLGWYVYRLVDPKDDSTFYVGKGTCGRVLQHFKDARDTRCRLTRKIRKIRSIERRGDTPRVIIHRHGLTEKEAFEVEAALIDVFPDAMNEMDGMGSLERGLRTLEEACSQYAAARAKIKEPVVLINIGREWYPGLPANPDRLYERTRRWWVVNPEQRKARYAMTVAHGIIRQVYFIDHWSKHDLRMAKHDPSRKAGEDKRIPKTRIRWQFTGSVAPEMRNYIGKSVAHYRDPGAQNPITYLNC